MKIVVSHLTRMRAPFICVAGIDPATGQHVRPVLESGQLGRSLLTRHGGPFDIAAVVDLGMTRGVGQPPEMEDYRFDRRRARCTSRVAPAEFWQLLMRASRQSLAEIFGDDLHRHGDTYVVDVGKGRASLGCLLPAAKPTLTVNSYNRIRLGLHRDGGPVWLPVTDLRLYEEEDGVTPRKSIVAHLAARISSGTGVLLSVGLSRPYFKAGDSAERHWLQVNNLHLEDDPTWQDGKQTGITVTREAAPIHRATTYSPLALPSLEDTRAPVYRTVSHALSVPVPTEGATTPGGAEREVMASLAVDSAIHHAISACWNILPEGERSLERVERELIRRLHHILQQVLEDAGAARVSPSDAKDAEQPGDDDRLTRLRAEYENAYRPWTLEDDEVLRQEFTKRTSVIDLAKLLARQPSAIRSRLRKLGLPTT